jgi:2-isopropylmalate synthase
MRKSIKLYDSTLREGAQAAGISFSVDDKLKIARKLDALGIRYIEGGWPGTSPRESEFFDKVKDLRLKHSKIVAFCATRKPRISCQEDKKLDLVIKARADGVNIYGKAWDFHIERALRTTKDENLNMISETMKYIKPRTEELFFTAEHFFAGYKSDKKYAMAAIEAALHNGANFIILADTNGGTLPDEIGEIISSVSGILKKPLGIELHNDANLAVANVLAAIKAGADLVVGTINGYGEKCGNLDLCTLIPLLKLKLGIKCVSDKQLAMLTEVSRYTSEIANLAHNEYQPFVGNSAFAHKSGIRVSAVLVDPATYEDIEPEAVGNRRKVLVSELAGRSNLVLKAREFGVDLEKDTLEAREILGQIKQLEKEGYQFEGAEASFELLVKKTIKTYEKPFRIVEHRVMEEKKEGQKIFSEATVKVGCNKTIVHKVAEGNGPVNALHNALMEALLEISPSLGVKRDYLKKLEMHDYKVRIVGEEKGTASEARALMEFTDGEKVWGTVGLSTDILEASWEALVDSFEYAIIQYKK